MIFRISSAEQSALEGRGRQSRLRRRGGVSNKPNLTRSTKLHSSARRSIRYSHFHRSLEAAFPHAHEFRACRHPLRHNEGREGAGDSSPFIPSKGIQYGADTLCKTRPDVPRNGAASILQLRYALFRFLLRRIPSDTIEDAEWNKQIPEKFRSRPGLLTRGCLLAHSTPYSRLQNCLETFLRMKLGALPKSSKLKPKSKF